jgi:hypothetical protein
MEGRPAIAGVFEGNSGSGREALTTDPEACWFRKQIDGVEDDGGRLQAPGSNNKQLFLRG